jgi:membrane-associated phospholipid phosphatase
MDGDDTAARLHSVRQSPMLARLMSLTIAIVLSALTVLLLLLEWRGVKTTLQLSFKGDIKRESAFLAQYGQSVATPIAAWLMMIAKGNDWRVFVLVVAPVLMASVACLALKRLLGRMRPNRENAGTFTGFSFKHDNKRESFPSSHSACAFALTVTLIHFWPEAAMVFWGLAFITAGLRYVLDAHFPSDVIAGSLLGLAAGHFGLAWIEPALARANIG